jgi:hypothetical protein
MTQQYLVGQLSALLGELERTAAEWEALVHDLRRVVECSQPPTLPALVGDVLELSDSVCWTALDQGDVGRFCSCARAAAELGEFIESAGLRRN